MSELAAEDLDFGSARADDAAERATSTGRSLKDASPGGALPGERTISPIAGRFGLGKSGKGLALLGLVAGSGVFLAATWSHPNAHRANAAPQEPARQVIDYASVRATPAPAPLSAGGVPGGAGPPSDAAAGTAPTLASPGVGAPSLTGLDGSAVPALAVGAAPGGAAGGAGTAASTDPKAAAAQQAAAAQAAKLEAIRGAPLLAFNAEVRGRDAGLAGALVPTAGRAAEAGGSELDQLRRGSVIGMVRAQRLPDRNFLLTAGALLPCVLETAMDTSAPGFVTCRISRDIYSDNGGVVLMEKGSRVIGEYRSGFAQGRARIFVLWDRITTPGGVAVDVSSPAADALGRAGFDGKIDSHFWQRFGGALLLTTVNGGLSAAATADARFANVAQAPNEAASIALQNSVNIPPTLTKPQGSEVGIMVSRDLDFSSVYALKGR